MCILNSQDCISEKEITISRILLKFLIGEKADT